MKAAKAAGAVTSFDLNFREKLWSIWGGETKAVEVIGRIVENVDVLVGNEEDLQKGLGIPGPEVAAKSKLDPSAFFGMIDKVVGKHPRVKVVATTLREVHSTNRHSWGAVAWMSGKTYQAPTCELDVLDRVGGGDGFASGFFYGLDERRDAGGSGEARLGARRAADDISGRHDHGHGGAGPRVCQRRFGANSTITTGRGSSMHAVLEQIGLRGIVPVVVINDAAHAAPLAEALMAGGLPCIEITFRTGAAQAAIGTIAKSHPGMLLGAGTVLTVDQVKLRG